MINDATTNNTYIVDDSTIEKEEKHYCQASFVRRKEQVNIGQWFM